MDGSALMPYWWAPWLALGSALIGLTALLESRWWHSWRRRRQHRRQRGILDSAPFLRRRMAGLPLSELRALRRQLELLNLGIGVGAKPDLLQETVQSALSILDRVLLMEGNTEAKSEMWNALRKAVSKKEGKRWDYDDQVVAGVMDGFQETYMAPSSENSGPSRSGEGPTASPSGSREAGSGLSTPAESEG